MKFLSENWKIRLLALALAVLTWWYVTNRVLMEP